VGITSVTVLAGGQNNTCSIVTGGTAECWGGNSGGQLGTNTTNGSLIPAYVFDMSTATSVTSGAQHSCFQLADKHIECTGYNLDGELGNGTTTSTLAPGAVTGL
jgi:alpha-tubulin suppressor-like RCC1 family protein